MGSSEHPPLHPAKGSGPPAGLYPRRSSLVWLLLLLVLGYLLVRDFAANVATQHVPVSQFNAAVESGKIHAAVIGDGWARGYPEDIFAAPVQTGEKAKASKSGEVLETTLVKGTEPALAQALKEKGVPYEAAPASAWGSVLVWWILPLVPLFFFWRWMLRRSGSQLGGGPGGLLSFGKMQARIVAESETGVGFRDVAGVDEAVDELQEIVDFLKTPDKFRRLGAHIPKGVLLIGPPGTGKTLLARAVAGEAHVPFFSLTASQFVEMFVGVGAARVRDLFRQAQEKAPSIIFIDELDAIGRSRGSSGIVVHEEREQTLDQLLAEMDGFDPRVGLIVLAATNRPEILDPALLRPGRFDRHVMVDRPDRNGREKILALHAQKVKRAANLDLRDIAAETAGFAGADLANVVNEAALLAARRGKDEVTRAEFEEAIERVVAGLEKKGRRISAHEREIVAHHEAGHALVGWMLPRAEPVRKVSIVPRGITALGYTRQGAVEDRYLVSEPELRARIATLLGGRAAEQLVYGEVSTGSVNDLQQATEIASAMIRNYGMSEQLGPVAWVEERRPIFSPQETGPLIDRHGLSERTQEIVDAEVQEIIQAGQETARRLLVTHRDRLEALASELLVREVVDEDQLTELLGPKQEESKTEQGASSAPSQPLESRP